MLLDTSADLLQQTAFNLSQIVDRWCHFACYLQLRTTLLCGRLAAFDSIRILPPLPCFPRLLQFKLFISSV